MRKRFLMPLTFALAIGITACGGSGGDDVTPTAESKKIEFGASGETDEEISTESKDDKSGSETKDSGETAASETSEASTKAENSSVVNENGTPGYYKLTKIIEDGKESDELSQMQSAGMNIFLVINEDGTGYMDTIGEKEDITWDDKNLYDKDGKDPASYTYSNGVISMDADGVTMEFSRLNPEEKADYIENGGGEIDYDALANAMDENDSTTKVLEGKPSTGTVSGEIDGSPVSIIGAEEVKDDEGKPAVRFYYEYTNKGDSPASAFIRLTPYASQDGKNLDSAFVWDNTVPEDNYDELHIMPGKTVRCTAIYSFDPDGGTIGLGLVDLFSDEAVYYYVDPKQMSGAPKEAFVFEEDEAAADQAKDLESKNDDVEILDAEFAKDSDSKDAVRVVINWTNKSEEPKCFGFTHSFTVMQDGYDLSTAMINPPKDSDNTSYYDFEAGKTGEISMCYELRSKSPVVVVITDDETGEKIGKVIDVK